MTEPTYNLHLGDCLDVLPTLEAQSVDAIICDPPYGTTACKWDAVIPFEPMWREIKRVLRPRGACVLFGSQPFTSALVMSNPKWYRHSWVWEKQKPTNFLQVKRQPLRSHEDITVFCRFGVRYHPQGLRFVSVKNGRKNKAARGVYRNVQGADYVQTVGNYPRSVLKFNTDTTSPHPTAKPLSLLEYLVKTYTDEGDTVLDFTMGSGTTGHACMNLGRRFIGIERDAGYFAIAQRRIAEAADPLHAMREEVA